MKTFKIPTKKINVSATFTINKTIKVPANWSGEQIDLYVENIDFDKFYDEVPDFIEMDWKLCKKGEKEC